MKRNLFVENLLQGDRHAIETFVNENQNAVFRTCLAYLQNENDAADLTQEVFIKAFEKLNQFKGESKISTWLLRIAINLSLNYLRDNKKRLLNADISEIKNLEDTRNSISRNEIRNMLKEAVYQLSEDQRRVFILNYQLDLSYKEIAEITGLTVSSIESLLFRARKRLREILIDYYSDLKQ